MKNFSFYLRTDGRISRKAMWLAVMLPICVISFALASIDVLVFQSEQFEFLGMPYTPLGAVTTILLLWPAFATTIRRLHDLNITGWWVAPMLAFYWVPDLNNFLQKPGLEKMIIVAWGLCLAVGGLLALAELFVPGTRGQNRFGEDPRNRG